MNRCFRKLARSKRIGRLNNVMRDATSFVMLHCSWALSDGLHS